MPSAEVSCGAVVYRKDHGKTQILLVKQRGDHAGWGIPKGHMEPGENYITTARREVKEETGVDVKILTRLPHVTLEKRSHKKVVVPYLAIQADDSEPSCDDEASEVVSVQWFDIDCLPPIYVYQRPIIDAALLILGGYVGEH